MAVEKNITILTGAGVSAESGLKTFRDNGGLWETHEVTDVATPEAFARDPELVYRFYNMRRANLTNVAHNEAHEALARLEAATNGQFTLVTQNVDNLHERAGSKNIIHMHGSLLEGRCNNCGNVTDWADDMDKTSNCPNCDAIGFMRPNIVWFGEMPFQMDRIYQILSDTDLFISIGTSGSVYPAAGFVAEIIRIGRAKAIELNLEASENHNLFHETRHGPATKVVTEYVDELLELA